jgi:hypothetical protein
MSDGVVVTVLDTETGERLLFGAPLSTVVERGLCAGAHRYIIVDVQPMPDGYTLADFNSDYPAALVSRARRMQNETAA